MDRCMPLPLAMADACRPSPAKFRKPRFEKPHTLKTMGSAYNLESLRRLPARPCG
jgi:hypothetical protein